MDTATIDVNFKHSDRNKMYLSIIKKKIISWDTFLLIQLAIQIANCGCHFPTTPSWPEPSKNLDIGSCFFFWWARFTCLFLGEKIILWKCWDYVCPAYELHFPPYSVSDLHKLALPSLNPFWFSFSVYWIQTSQRGMSIFMLSVNPLLALRNNLNIFLFEWKKEFFL